MQVDEARKQKQLDTMDHESKTCMMKAARHGHVGCVNELLLMKVCVQRGSPCAIPLAVAPCV
jgi:hypothetical protein